MHVYGDGLKQSVLKQFSWDHIKCSLDHRSSSLLLTRRSLKNKKKKEKEKRRRDVPDEKASERRGRATINYISCVLVEPAGCCSATNKPLLCGRG